MPPEEELEFTAIRAGGPGGQKVNKTSSAVQLRFDIPASSLPQPVKERLLALHDRRISREGVLVIKAQRHRSQALNRQEALHRLAELLARAVKVPLPRRPTRPGRAARERRLREKSHRSRIKQWRGKVPEA